VQPDRESSDTNAETTGQIVTQALSAGYRHIDTAQSYGTERGGARPTCTPTSQPPRSKRPAGGWDRPGGSQPARSQP
jgi:aryl-alcohol dehydrogenase-like predicted oxidoreductase